MTTALQQRVKRQYGFPFLGCVSSVDRHEAPLGAIGQDSREMLIEPGRVAGLGKVKRRHGATNVTASTGGLEMPVADASMRAVELFELPTTAAANGFPVIACMFADESKRYGQLWLRDGSTDHTEGEEFGSTHYPTTASTQGNIKMPPLPYDGNGATGYMRLAYEENRRRTIAGTRRRTGVKNWEYYGGFLSCPSKATRDYNLSSGSGSNNLRRFPTGHIPPLRPPDVPAASYPTKKATAAPWKMGDKFFLAMAFEWEDGSVSMPFIPRDINATLTAGFGLVTVNDDGTSNYYDYLPYRNIRIGPPGVVKRRLYRSNKISKDLITAGSWPDIGTLKLCAIIENNTSTDYNDPRGNDAALFTDALLRTDQVWPSRGRYDWNFDHRHATGYLRPNPCAIVLAPTGSVASGDRNAQDDDAALIDTVCFLLRISEDTSGNKTLRLRKTAFAAVPTETTISLLGATSLQALCDTINATVVGGGGGEWAAQVVPGADYNAGSNQLAPTFIANGNCTLTINSPTISSTDSLAGIAEGMKINHANFAAGTYVKTKNANGTLTASANSSGNAGPVTVNFYVDTGDDGIVTDGTLGNMRSYGNSYPTIIGFKQSYLDAFPTDKRDFMVTTAGPTQRPNAANMFHTSPGGRFQAESEAGILMGGAPLHNGCVVFYSNRIGYWVNKRSGSTGEDADYRLDWIDFSHGCKSPYSIVFGNNWVGCWRDDGFWVFDGDKQAVISGDHFAPAADVTQSKGDFVYEAGLCNAAAAADSVDFYMHAHYRDGRIWLSLRVGASESATYCYDCSPGVEAAGLAQVLTPEGQPYGWSPRCHYSWRGFGTTGIKGAIGSANTSSSGVKLYQGDDTNDKTNCGLVQEFETTGTYTDGADVVQFSLYTTRDLLGGMKKFALGGQLTFLYRLTLSSGSSTLTVVVYRDQQRLASTSYVLPATASDTFTRKVINPKMGARSAGEVIETYIAGGNDSTLRIFELSGIEAEADVLDSLT